MSIFEIHSSISQELHSLLYVQPVIIFNSISIITQKLSLFEIHSSMSIKLDSLLFIQTVIINQMYAFLSLKVTLIIQMYTLFH